MTKPDELPPLCACGCAQRVNVPRFYGQKMPRFLPGHNSRDPEIKAKRSATYRKTLHAGRPAIPTYICQCGCGEIIPPSPVHRYRPPTYIRGHYFRMGTASRLEALRRARAEGRIKPPAGWVAPTGVCECGCGKPTPVAVRSRPSFGQYAGYPLRFIHGHNSRGVPPELTSGWKGGRPVDHDGYVMVKRPDHPAARKDGYVLVHRMVYEDSRGVRLPPGVLVHHVNGDRTDNRPENLVAFTRVEHRQAHTIAQALVGLFLDDRLLEAAKAHVREYGTLPDLEALTAQVYGHR